MCLLKTTYVKSCIYMLLYYAKACNELAGSISASLRLDSTASLEMSQWWRAVDNTVSDLTGPRLEPQTSRSTDERVTARPTGKGLCQRNAVQKPTE